MICLIPGMPSNSWLSRFLRRPIQIALGLSGGSGGKSDFELPQERAEADEKLRRVLQQLGLEYGSEGGSHQR